MNLLCSFFCLVLLPYSWASFERTEDDPVESEILRVIENERINRETRSKIAQIDVITVDTHDKQTCHEILNEISGLRAKGNQNLSELCQQNSDSPYATLYLMKEVNQDEWKRKINFGRLSSAEQSVFTDTRNTFLMSLGVAGFIYMLPESVSKWDKSRLGTGMINKYKENVFEKGLTLDNDDPLINWVGHPISGAIYYQIARHNGYSPMASFGYSALMSTFFWELGVEAFAEPPSIQDLIITPVVGSLVGEVFHRADNYIAENDGEVLGSKSAGSVLMFVFHPMRTISKGINSLFDTRFVKEGQSQIIQRRLEKFNPSDKEIRYIGLEFEFKY